MPVSAAITSSPTERGSGEAYPRDVTQRCSRVTLWYGLRKEAGHAQPRLVTASALQVSSRLHLDPVRPHQLEEAEHAQPRVVTPAPPTSPHPTEEARDA